MLQHLLYKHGVVVVQVEDRIAAQEAAAHTQDQHLLLHYKITELV